ncbi:MAG: SDR family oxidoreductase [Phycisphaerales bacterium]|nr:SDR family oxidoreductase [Phycisphaerales bacterium]
MSNLNPSDTTGAIIVFGAAGGIGTALCQTLRASGRNVLAVGRTRGRLDILRGTVDVETALADATHPAEVDALFAAALATHGRIAGVANLAGAFILKPAHLTTDSDFANQLTANLITAFNILRASVKAMHDAGGSIVLMSSVAARIGLANHEAVAAAKAGVEGLTLAAAATYAPRQIRVNAVAPGLTRTPLTGRLTSNEASLKASTAMHPLGRIGEARDVASAIAWLLGPESSWVTGQVIGVDGGLSRVRSRS